MHSMRRLSFLVLAVVIVVGIESRDADAFSLASLRSPPTTVLAVFVDSDDASAAPAATTGSPSGRAIVPPDFFICSSTSLKHLEDTDLPDDYSRPWTPSKIKALAGAMASGAACGGAGYYLIDEQVSVLTAAVGIGAGWFLLGGKQVAEDERPINGGYDRKLVADRPGRLKRLVEDLGVQPREVVGEERLQKALRYAHMVHKDEYLTFLKESSLASDRPRRLYPTLARTLIDQRSYEAALASTADWMDAVDQESMALVRPPGHHARPSRGSGGCLLNHAVIAAVYALDTNAASSVSILDFDAHHGDGIAECVKHDPRIRYCSIHEQRSNEYMLQKKKNLDDDDVSPSINYRGPLDNILNVNLPTGTTWNTGYQRALEEEAIPFLCGSDLLLVAAGFDALEADKTSGLLLQPGDFRSIARALQQNFTRIACGLEGGYCWQDGTLSAAVSAFAEGMKEEE